MKNVNKRSVLIAVLALCSFVLGWYSSDFHTSLTQTASVQAVRYKDPEYSFISPLVGLSTPGVTTFSELNGIKNDVQRVIEKAKAGGYVKKVGVYFRLPDNAHTFGISEDDKFDPGSLLKVPIMIAYLRQAQADPSVLTKKLYYQAPTTQDLPNALKPQLAVNRSYTVGELIKAMIVDSDNIAKDLLLSSIDPSYLNDVFTEMNVEYLQDPAGTISPRAYIKFLSRLYSATFLDRYYSNYALTLLSQTTYADGLVAGLPDSVPVAHKYGERGIYEERTPVGIELHDCGIVYLPGNNNYYLCVMTEGTSIEAITKVIKDISATVYADRSAFTH